MNVLAARVCLRLGMYIMNIAVPKMLSLHASMQVTTSPVAMQSSTT